MVWVMTSCTWVWSHHTSSPCLPCLELNFVCPCTMDALITMVKCRPNSSVELCKSRPSSWRCVLTCAHYTYLHNYTHTQEQHQEEMKVLQASVWGVAFEEHSSHGGVAFEEHSSHGVWPLKSTALMGVWPLKSTALMGVWPLKSTALMAKHFRRSVREKK